jgi:hypothetical protein
MDKNTQTFIDYVKSECKKHKVKFKPYKRGYVKLADGVKCGGFFDDSDHPAVLAFAQGREDFLGLMVHEYCHMTQWLEKIPLWKEAEDGLSRMWDWLSGTEVEDIDGAINIARNLELDNEKRTVEMIKKWNLPIDVNEYIKKANAYIIFYNYLRISRKWSDPTNSPYRNQNIVDAMSDKFDMDYENLSPELEELYKREKI